MQTYYARNRSVAETLRGWSSKFKNRPKPKADTISILIEKFERTFSLKDDTEGRGAPRRSRTPDNIAEVSRRISDDPTQSVRGIARDTTIPKSSVQRILRLDLEIFPYKIQMFQRLEGDAQEKRLKFCEDICEEIDQGHIDINKIIFSDEAHFYLDGYVNSQNYRVWGSEKPEVTATKPLHPERVTVWTGICASGILGPYFIRNKSVDKTVYKRILTKAFDEAASKGWIDDYHFQQDGAAPHIEDNNMRLIRENFEDRVISRFYPEKFNCGIAWPPYSPDLNPCDFFLWGFTKDKVYRNRPTTLLGLEQRVSAVQNSITTETFKSVIEHFEKRARMVIHREGMHIENIMH